MLIGAQGMLWSWTCLCKRSPEMPDACYVISGFLHDLTPALFPKEVARTRKVNGQAQCNPLCISIPLPKLTSASCSSKTWQRLLPSPCLIHQARWCCFLTVPSSACQCPEKAVINKQALKTLSPAAWFIYYLCCSPSPSSLPLHPKH